MFCLLLRLKSRSTREPFHHPAFMGNCPTISHTFFSLIYPVDEFSLKEMGTWGRSRISFYCFFLFSVNQVHCFGLNPGARGEHLMFTASAKTPEHEVRISPSNLYGQLPNYWSHVWSLIYPVDECSIKEIKMWGQSEISFYCFAFGVN